MNPASRPFASPAFTRALASAVLTVGVIGAFAGVTYAVNGATQARGQVVVPAEARPGARFAVAGPAVGTATPGEVTVDPEDNVIRLDAPGRDQASWLEISAGNVQLRAADSTVAEQVLARGGFAVLGLCLGAGAVLLRRLLVSIADGDPFERRNAGRIALVAGLVAVAAVAYELLPILATDRVVNRIGWSGLVHSQLDLPLAPLAAVPILLVLAQAFRRGTELAADTEGLV
ncbi:MAG: hypothetical protein QOD41_940 [Cryptosporangiaceae bacterium]|nr:hypothetical protein [Cryptosporangiaceae bacterium]